MEKVRRQVTVEAAKTLFHQTVSSAQFEVTRVELIKNPLVARAASMHFEISQKRRENQVFQLPLPDTDDTDRQDKAVLRELVENGWKTAPWAKAFGTIPPILPVWHGAHEKNVDAISQTGFACLVNDDAEDPGWHANGRYNALEAELARLYSMDFEDRPPNDTGEWVVMLSAAIVGEVYCITPGRLDYPSGTLPPTMPNQCKFYGGHFQAPADTHIVGIDGEEMLGTRPGTAEFHEIVSAQDAQLLPLAKIFFKSRDDTGEMGSGRCARPERVARGWGRVQQEVATSDRGQVNAGTALLPQIARDVQSSITSGGNVPQSSVATSSTTLSGD